jgi:hypothetical protein
MSLSTIPGPPGAPGLPGGTSFQIAVFSTSGTFIVPTGISSIIIELWGGGGGGGGEFIFLPGVAFGGGGGSGAYVRGTISVTPGQSIPVTVGTGGLGGNTVVADGTSGTASSIGTFIAGGGSGSLGHTGSSTGGAGGLAISTNIGINGETGQNGATGRLGRVDLVAVPLLYLDKLDFSQVEAEEEVALLGVVKLMVETVEMVWLLLLIKQLFY